MAAFECSRAGTISVTCGTARLKLVAPAAHAITTLTAPSVGHLADLLEPGKPVHRGMVVGRIRTLAQSFDILSPGSGTLARTHATDGAFVGFAAPILDIEAG